LPICRARSGRCAPGGGGAPAIGIRATGRGTTTGCVRAGQGDERIGGCARCRSGGHGGEGVLQEAEELLPLEFEQLVAGPPLGAFEQGKVTNVSAVANDAMKRHQQVLVHVAIDAHDSFSFLPGPIGRRANATAPSDSETEKKPLRLRVDRRKRLSHPGAQGVGCFVGQALSPANRSFLSLSLWLN